MAFETLSEDHEKNSAHTRIKSRRCEGAWAALAKMRNYLPGRGGLHFRCSMTGRYPFLRISITCLGKNCLSIPCLGIFRLQNNGKTIEKTIAYCFSTNSQYLFRNFWSIFIPGSGIQTEKWYPEKRHVPYSLEVLPPPGITPAYIAFPILCKN